MELEVHKVAQNRRALAVKQRQAPAVVCMDYLNCMAVASSSPSDPLGLKAGFWLCEAVQSYRGSWGHGGSFVALLLPKPGCHHHTGSPCLLVPCCSHPEDYYYNQILRSSGNL